MTIWTVLSIKRVLRRGNYSVAVNALTDDKYKDYVLPTAAQKVEVKKDIAYKKVDVSNEIKKESEINAAKRIHRSRILL